MALFSNKTKKTAKTAIETTTQEPKLSVGTTGSLPLKDVIIAPHVTEKASLSAELNKYTFRVAWDANKIEVKKAIQAMYKVHVSNVHMVTIPSKKRQNGKYKGVKSGLKKAIVTLQKGDKIDVITS